MNKAVVSIRGLTKEFAGKKVLNQINFDVHQGETLALLGTNGAGKSTLIKLILGLLKPTCGDILLNHYSPFSSLSRLDIGLVPQTNHFIDALTAKETIHFVGQHYKKRKPMDELVNAFDLEEFINKKVAVLSEGQKRRLMLAIAFVGMPEMVFLDEPTVGLDIQSRYKLWKYIHQYRASGKTVFLTTHYLEEAEDLADRVLVLHRGGIKADVPNNKADKTTNLKELFINMTEN